MPHELLSLRIPVELKAWLEWEVDRRKKTGDRQATMTALVVEVLEAKAKAMSNYPVFA
jgi:hypothetical protein